MNAVSAVRPPLQRLSHKPRPVLSRGPAPALPPPSTQAPGIQQPLATMPLRAEKRRRCAEMCKKIISARSTLMFVPRQPSPTQSDGQLNPIKPNQT